MRPDRDPAASSALGKEGVSITAVQQRDYTLLISILAILPSSLNWKKLATLHGMKSTVTVPFTTTWSPSRAGSPHLPAGFTDERYLANASLPWWVPSLWKRGEQTQSREKEETRIQEVTWS